MKVSNDGLALIRQFEGCKLEAYRDSVGVWTISVGHTGSVIRGDKITQKEADTLLRQDVADAEKAVTELVKVPVNQSQFDALVSLVFNIGRGAFSDSTLLRRLNDESYVQAAAEFLRWNKADGNVLSGLARRREAEYALFLS